MSAEKLSNNFLSIDKSLDGIPFLAYKKYQLHFHIDQNSVEYQNLMVNWFAGWLSLSFISEIIRISILSLIWCISNSGLFRRELIFKCPIFSLFMFLALRDLNFTYILAMSRSSLTFDIYSTSINQRVEVTTFTNQTSLFKMRLFKNLERLLAKICATVFFNFVLSLHKFPLPHYYHCQKNENYFICSPHVKSHFFCLMILVNLNCFLTKTKENTDQYDTA